MLWILISVALAALIYFYLIKPLSFWKDQGIAYEKSWPIVGYMAPAVFRTKSFVDIVKGMYDAFPKDRYYGTLQFTTPVLIIRDVELIKKITVKDFDYFTDHNSIISEDVDPLMGRNLLALKGQRWRHMRATLSPAFTGAKMRTMFSLLCECADQFAQYFLKKRSYTIDVEMKDIFTRFTNDAIASVAFGLKVDSLEERDNEFYVMGRTATNFSGLQSIKFLLLNFSPALMKFLRIGFFTETVSNFFRRIVKETIAQREKEGLVRPDMIHLLMEARKGFQQEHQYDNSDAGFATVQDSQVGKMEKPQYKGELTDDDITAQALIFFFGGFETSATLMSFVAYELAVNTDVQEKLQKEIDATLENCNGKITYEGLLGMKYLDMVLSEVLRKWPPGFQIDRVCVKNYTIQPESPEEVPFEVEKGQLIIIPVVGIHHDPQFFPNPDKFDPERFSDENKHNIDPGSYMPFGAGPRSCIASRFALLENKTLIFHLLSKFDIVPTKKTQIPLVLGTKGLNIMPEGGFWLGLRQRKILQD